MSFILALILFILGGIEHLDPIPGVQEPGYGQVIIHADYTHSLVGAVILSLVLGAGLGLRYGKKSGVVIGLVSMSHWFLDLIMHRGDMPILPGDASQLPRLGFGLWRSPVASGALELLLVVAGALLYWQAARRVAGTDAIQLRRATWCGALALGFGVLTLALNLAGL